MKFLCVAIVAIYLAVFSLISVPCPFFSLTGYLCPGCGSTRGMSRLLSGDVEGCFRYNPLFPLFPFVMIVTALFNAQLTSRQRIVKICWMAIVVLLLLFSIFRNIPSSVFDILRPPIL